MSPNGTFDRVAFQGSRYLFSTEKMSRGHARQECDKLQPGGKLMSVDSLEEMRFAQSILHQQMGDLRGDSDFLEQWHIGKFYEQILVDKKVASRVCIRSAVLNRSH